MNIKKTANFLVNFAINRLAEIFGILISISGILFAGLLLLVSLLSYSPEDPNFIFPKNTEIKNILGIRGSIISDLFFQSVGLISYLISITLVITGINILIVKQNFLIIENIFFVVIYSIFGTLFLNHYH